VIQQNFSVYNFPRLTQLQVSQFLTYAILKKVKTYNILEMRASFVIAGVKRQTEVTEE